MSDIDNDAIVKDAVDTTDDLPENGTATGGTAPDDGSGSSMLPIVSACVGVAGIILAMFVSWILSVLAGVLAIVLAQLAASKHAAHPMAIRIGRVLGIICIVANIAMVAYYAYRLVSLEVF